MILELRKEATRKTTPPLLKYQKSVATKEQEDKVLAHSDFISISKSLPFRLSRSICHRAW
jgi:hypothetical protein